MTWTKTKLTLVIGVLLLLAAGITLVTIQMVGAVQSRASLARMQGNWEGTLTAGQSQLRLVFRIFKTNDTYHAAFDSIDQGVKGIPVEKLSARNNSVHAELPAINADYVAELNREGTELSGKWKQLNRSYRLTLKKTAEPDRVAGPMADSDYAPRTDSDLQGAWEGTLAAGDTSLRLALRIAETTPGTFQAQMDSVDQGAKNMPVTVLTYHQPVVRFEMPAINGVFVGSLNDQHDQMAGKWTQRGKEFALTFQRAQAAGQSATETALDYGSGAGNQAQGHWKGALQVNRTTVHLVFHIALLPDGSYSATMDSPDQGATGIPASTAEFDSPNLRLEWRAIGAVFAGRLENNRLAGNWTQGKAVLPLNLERDAAH